MAFALVGIAACISTHVHAAPPTRPNFSILHTVVISKDPRTPAHVTTTMHGANELRRVILEGIEPSWFHNLTATGELIPSDTHEWTWIPDHIHGTLSYDVRINHPRTINGFDSYHGGSWILTRTSDLLPHKRFVRWRPIRSLTRMTFQLPPRWQVVSAMRSLGPAQFEARTRRKAITAPYGWLLMGDLTIHQFTTAKVSMTVASPRVMDYNATALIALLKQSMPRLKTIMRDMPQQILVVVGPDPMWRGGLSGEDSLYLNHNLALISSDYTSTALHELFHITQGFTKKDRTTDWIVEGLAEYYSLRLLRDMQMLSRKQFVRGVRKFDRQGVWRVNLTTTRDRKALYNAAPLIFFTIDEMIQQHTGGKKSLRTVVKRLGKHHEITNTILQEELTKLLPGTDWQRFLTRHARLGKRPNYEKYLITYERK